MTLFAVQVASLISLGFCLSFIVFQFFKLIRLGKPSDRSKSIGNEKDGIIYSFTGAMSPTHKETAYLHLPTYTMGIIFHVATFLGIAVFFVKITGLHIPYTIAAIISAAMTTGFVSGVIILIKRITLQRMRLLSNPDDYISNIVVDIFQLTTAIALLFTSFDIVYYIVVCLLLLYFPLGKLRHAVYFFAARYHLGFFYGRRGVWPQKNK